MGKIETEDTYYPVCPHCGARQLDDWEIDFGDDTDGQATIDCMNCDREMVVTRHVTVTYDTRPSTEAERARDEVRRGQETKAR